MKVLFVVHSIYDKDHHALKKNKVGNAIIVGDILRNFTREFSTDCIITEVPVGGANLGYCRLISTATFELARYLRPKDLEVLMHITSLKKMLKELFARAVVRKSDNLLNKEAYDLVCIHDFSPTNMELLKLCIKKKIKCIVTLHLYVGNDTKIGDQNLIQLRTRERFLVEETNVPITVVGKGMKRRILGDYKNVPPERITVIPNGTYLPELTLNADDRPEYTERKTFLCVGTVGLRKNQLQLLHSLDYLDPQIRKQIRILFIGNDGLSGQLQQEIQDGQYADVAEYMGGMQHEELMQYYQKSYAVISTSLNEAFGLIFIEGFACGVPAVFFDDIDAVEELYTPEAVELIHGKECRDIAQAITVAVGKQWDKVKIRAYAEKFDIKRISARYEALYRETVTQKKE